MSRIIAILVLALLPLQSIAQLSKDMLIGNVLENYGIVAGAWHLNNHCKVLSDSLAKEFESNVAAITVAMRRGMGSHNILLRIQSSSKSIIDKKPYSKCQDEAKKVITKTVLVARNWVQGIGKAKNSRSSSELSNKEKKRYSALVAAYHIEDKCKFGSDQDLADLQLMLNAVRKALNNRGVEMAPLNKIGIGVRKQVAKGPYSQCNDQTKIFTSRVRNKSWAWVKKLTTKNPYKVNKSSKQGAVNDE